MTSLDSENMGHTQDSPHLIGCCIVISLALMTSRGYINPEHSYTHSGSILDSFLLDYFLGVRFILKTLGFGNWVFLGKVRRRGALVAPEMSPLSGEKESDMKMQSKETYRPNSSSRMAETPSRKTSTVSSSLFLQGHVPSIHTDGEQKRKIEDLIEAMKKLKIVENGAPPSSNTIARSDRSRKAETTSCRTFTVSSSPLQGQVPSNHPDGEQMRKIEDLIEAMKKLKIDENGAPPSSKTNVSQGLATFILHQKLAKQASGCAFLESVKNKNTTMKKVDNTKSESEEPDGLNKKPINRSDRSRKAETLSCKTSTVSSSLFLQGQVPSKHPDGEQKTKIEDLIEAMKKFKIDDNGAVVSPNTIAHQGLVPSTPPKRGHKRKFSDLDENIVSRFIFHKELGNGCFGCVYLASVKNKNTTMAIKVIAKNQVDNLLQESRVLRRTSGKPYLCSAFAAFQTRSYAFLVMQYLPGGSLEEVLEARGPLDVNTAALCTAQVICGLQHLHEIGVIHRDLKTENILIDRQGHSRICDFGYAAENVFGAMTIFGLAGAPYYNPPEMLTGNAYGSSADWWAFGVLLYRLLTNNFPFSGGNNLLEYRQVVLEKEPTYPHHLSDEAKDILPKLLCRDCHRRLGWHGDIRQHPFYSGIDWVKVEDKTISPPFPPALDQNNISPTSHPLDLSFLQDEEDEDCLSNADHIPDFSFEEAYWPL
ncbi:uncharacterized protein [Engystomops pustulosus]|uniref:uncharacterized protein n=1 Tax=Engystomops pustulosus TaxID=76066 RepID=UPI003AFA7F98